MLIHVSVYHPVTLQVVVVRLTGFVVVNGCYICTRRTKRRRVKHFKGAASFAVYAFVAFSPIFIRLFVVICIEVMVVYGCSGGFFLDINK